ncbi:MAG: GGDEF domain-containing protein [Caldimonas sp.]
MLVHPPSVLFAVAALLLVASGAAASLGFRPQSRRGSRWWLSANVILAVGIVLQAVVDPIGEGAPLAALCVLQWPIIMLAGVRRFYSRGATRMPEWADRMALIVAALVTVGTWLAPFEFATTAQIFVGCAFALTSYAAIAVSRLEDFASTTTLRTLRVALVASAIVQAAWLAVDVAYLGTVIAPADVAVGSMIAIGAVALLMTQLSLVMNHERRIAHLVASQRKLKHLVDVDPLTRLPNRRHFHELAERAVEVARDASTLIVFDVDRLKRVNELLGHANGDEALRQIGTALRETLRRRDVAGRIGGDEFAAILPKTRLADSAIVVSRIIARLDDRQVAPRIAKIALNVGSVQMNANETIGDALRRAEAVMVSVRNEARRSDTMPMPRETAPDSESPSASAPSSMMSLIPVGEVTVS